MAQLPKAINGVIASIVTAVFFAALVGCEHDVPIQPGGVEPKLSSIQVNIFDQRCALSGCHLGGSAPFGLDLSEGKSFDNLVNVPSGEVPTLDRVEPGDPDRSYLMMKIEGAPGIQGQRMPLGQEALSAQEMEAIRNWIIDGALDN